MNTTEDLKDSDEQFCLTKKVVGYCVLYKDVPEVIMDIPTDLLKEFFIEGTNLYEEACTNWKIDLYPHKIIYHRFSELLKLMGAELKRRKIHEQS